MIAVGESGEKVVILSDDAGALLRLEMSDDAAAAMMAQLTVLLEARAARKGQVLALPTVRPPGLVVAGGDPVDEARARDAAELARREAAEKQESAREARRARAGVAG